ncbi:MAG: SUMF1/EgtB/PvdO family nonheme iron enzyme [Myxococcales bacterium]|nr:SUMF1/EgtB/PvdO family nonheme iron enzyme [Myxococcales bacterium]
MFGCNRGHGRGVSRGGEPGCDRTRQERVFSRAARRGWSLLQQSIRRQGRAPCECVDWYHADAYCRALGKRLPTEWGGSGPPRARRGEALSMGR